MVTLPNGSPVTVNVSSVTVSVEIGEEVKLRLNLRSKINVLFALFGFELSATGVGNVFFLILWKIS
jgi:hypothetical protein